jgi:predicted NACHT family NTPase
MGEPLFNLACRLGWLNLVDREAKTDEAVYAFFHPTFQEYFAACAIDDWRYFLNHNLALCPKLDLPRLLSSLAPDDHSYLEG